jgi:ParB family transcriptional regulator, chromosome partitioning protein
MNREQVSLPLQQLKPNRWNRKTFDSQGLLELSESIKQKGILEPLIVRKLDDGTYEIASGDRRSKAAHMAGLTEAPCLVQELKDEDVQDMNLISNIQREDLSALEKAAMVKARMESGGLTQNQMAKKLGKSEAFITELLGFLNLPDKVHESVAGLSMNTNQLRAITALPNDEYKEQIAKELQDGTIKPEHVEHRAHQLNNGFKASMAKRAKKNGQATEQTNGGSPEQRTNPGADQPTAAKAINPPSVAPKSAGPQSGSSVSQVITAPSPKGSVLDAAKTDLLNLLPQESQVAQVLRQHAQKASGKTLLRWGGGLLLTMVLWHPILKTFNYAFSRLMHVEVNQAINKNTVPSPSALVNAIADAPQKFTAAMLSPSPAPTGLKPELLSAHKIHFTWNAVPGCTGYNFYSARSWEINLHQENTKPITKTEAYWKPDFNGPDDFKFAITAIDDHDHESVHSDLIDVDLRG